MAKKQKAFRLDDKTLQELESLCNSWKINQTESVERAIHLAFESYTDSYTEKADSDTETDILNNAFKLLEKELEIKNSQIKELNNQIKDKDKKINEKDQELKELRKDNSQGLLNAQALHAMDKQPIKPLESQEEKKPLLVRIKESLGL